MARPPKPANPEPDYELPVHLPDDEREPYYLVLLNYDDGQESTCSMFSGYKLYLSQYEVERIFYYYIDPLEDGGCIHRVPAEGASQYAMVDVMNASATRLVRRCLLVPKSIVDSYRGSFFELR